MNTERKEIVRAVGRALGIGSFLLVTACGGGGGGGGGGSATPVVGQPPAAGGSGNATADAGTRQAVSRNTAVTLDGSGSSDPEGDALTYRWNQVAGPDVTGGSGFLTGAQPGFTAPGTVSTLAFELRVTDSRGPSAPARVLIDVLESTDGALFVDGDAGSDDDGDGSRSNPFATIAFALEQVEDGDDIDIYVKSLADDARYDETGDTLRPSTFTSLYGGYDSNWVRDVNGNRTGVDGDSVAVDFADVDGESWFSGFDIHAADGANASSVVTGVSVRDGDGVLTIEDNTVLAGDVGEGNSTTPQSSYGLRLAGVSAVRVYRNEITAGRGADGNSGNSGSLGGADGGDGARGG